MLHSARKRFIETEADEQLRRALRHKTRTSTSTTHQTGVQVYYKRKIQVIGKVREQSLDMITSKFLLDTEDQ